ncbi:hypothetical protein DMH04_44230, partial [Kibdelosporangium aridum]
PATAVPTAHSAKDKHAASDHTADDDHFATACAASGSAAASVTPGAADDDNKGPQEPAAVSQTRCGAEETGHGEEAALGDNHRSADHRRQRRGRGSRTTPLGRLGARW